MHAVDLLAQTGPYGDDLGEYVRNSILGHILAYVLLLALGLALVQRDRRRRARGEVPPRAPVPDWYPDPWNPQCERWWNGVRWTPDVRWSAAAFPPPWEQPWGQVGERVASPPWEQPSGPTPPPGDRR